MKKQLFTAFALGLSLLGGMAMAQSAPTRLRGTIQQVSDSTLAITIGDGRTVTVALTDKTHVVGISRATMSDIKPDSYIGTAAIPQADGSQVALEVSVFDPAMRGVGDGHYAWDLAPGSTMTNGAVGDLVGTSGRTMTVKYKGGEQKVMVPESAPIVAVAPADRSLLKAGAHAIVIAPQGGSGQPEAVAVLVGRDGVVPPM